MKQISHVVPLTLTTKHLSLRPLIEADQNLIIELYTDPALMAHMMTPPFSRQQAIEYMDLCLAMTEGKVQGGFMWTIVLSSNMSPIGIIGLYEQNISKTTAKTGCMLLRKAQGNGYATEAYHAVLSHLFDILELQYLEASCSIHNPPSIRLFQRLGFEQLPSGEGAVSSHFCMTHKSWQQLKLLE